jgi:hypothetical protein
MVAQPTSETAPTSNPNKRPAIIQATQDSSQCFFSTYPGWSPFVNSTQDLRQPVADRKNHHQHKLVGHRNDLSPEALQETRQDRRFRRQLSLAEPRHVSTAVIMALRATIKPRIAAERPATPSVTWRACLTKPAASARGSRTQIRRPDSESDFPGSRAVRPASLRAMIGERTASIRLSEGTAAEIFAKRSRFTSTFSGPGTQGGSRRLPGRAEGLCAGRPAGVIGASPVR